MSKVEYRWLLEGEPTTEWDTVRNMDALVGLSSADVTLEIREVN